MQLFFFIYPAEASNHDQKLARAENLLETGKPDSSAVLLYELLDSVETGDERVRVLYYLARAMEQLGRLGERINYLIMAREVGPNVEFANRVRFEYAQILLETGNFDGCIGIAREFKEHYSTSPLMPDILYIEGNAHLFKGEYLRAFNLFNEIEKNHLDSEMAAESIAKEGICLFYLDLIAGAIERFEHYIFETPEGKNIDEALYFLGLSYERSGQPEFAIEEFKRLILEYPSYPEIMKVYFKLGKHYFEINQYAESENMFENYIYNTDKTDENHDEALLYIERINYKTGKYSSETEIGENFVIKYPESPLTPGLFFDLARYYNMVGKTEDALEKYRILMNNSLYADYADSAAFLIADTYASHNQNEKARSFLKQIAYESQDSLRTQKMFYKLGTLNEEWELYDEAITWYDSSLTVGSSPDLSLNALLGISRVFRSLKRLYEASNTLERIINEYPDHPAVIEVYLELADIYVLQGRLKLSILSAEKSLKLAGETRKTGILLYRAELYEEIDEDQALRMYSLIYENTRNSREQRTKALMRFGNLSLVRGDRQSALNAYARIINGDADSVAVLKAKNKISTINVNSDSSSIKMPED